MPIVSPASGSGSGVTVFDYVEITAPVTITATTAATATTCITGNAVTYDGVTAVIIEAYFVSLSITPATAVPHFVVIELYQDGTDLGTIAQMTGDVIASAMTMTCIGRRRMTPTAGSHTYSLRGWKSIAGDTASVQAGAGGAGTLYPSYLRVATA